MERRSLIAATAALDAAPMRLHLSSGDQDLRVVIERDELGTPMAWVLSGSAIGVDGAVRVTMPASADALRVKATGVEQYLKLIQQVVDKLEGSAERAAELADHWNGGMRGVDEVPAQLAEVVGGWGLPPLLVVAAIMLFYVVLGAVMDELSMILLTIPIFFPMIMGLDFGMPKESVAIWFGIMVLMTVGFGLLAPPVGLNVYVVNSLAKDVPIAESYRGVMPFLISDTLRTIVLLLFPSVSLWLVQYVS